MPEAFVETIETGWWTTCLEVVPPRERSRGRFHVYRESLTKLTQSDGIGWADCTHLPDDGLPVVELFGTAAFPPRLWLYTNFHCNLACDYCVVASSPRARRRSLGLDRHVYGRPIARLAGREQLVIQTSLDGARASTHDAWRGRGSFERAMDGIAYACELGLALRVAMTETPENRDEVEDLRALLADQGVIGDDFAVRPLVRRGFAADEPNAVEVDEAAVAPELTVTADGVHWHPIGGDLESSPDMLVEAGPVPLGRAKQLITERFLSRRHADRTLPAAFRCAV